jgi:hypothetical protein
MPDNLLHTRFNFYIAFLMNDLPSNMRMRLERDKIIAIFLFRRNDSLKSAWASEGVIHNASSQIHERQWGNWSFGYSDQTLLQRLRAIKLPNNPVP